MIIVSHGDRTALERALAAVAGRCRRMEAEIIVVRGGSDADSLALGAAYPSVRFLTGVGSGDQAEMREAGMRVASGDIVAFRQDGAVGDGMWLEAFDATVGTVDEGRGSEVEVPLVASLDEAAAGGERRRSAGFLAPTAMSPAKRRGEVVRGTAAAEAMMLARESTFTPPVARER